MTTNNFIDSTQNFRQRRAAAKWFQTHFVEKKSRYDLFQSFIDDKSHKLHCYLLLIIHNSKDISNQSEPSDRLVSLILQQETGNVDVCHFRC